MFAGKKSAQNREILISESAWEEMTCLFAPSLDVGFHSGSLFHKKKLLKMSSDNKIDNQDEMVAKTISASGFFLPNI